ncbi:MAG TPA: TRAP transporter large permease subunit [Synergistales bacterium]|mgnify:CR=1 FL=1|nr:TRAP transporter large permease subunit [Synergistales bacterium]
MSPEVLAVSMLLILIFMVMTGIRLAFAMMFLGVVFGFYYRGPAMLSLFMQNTFGVMQNEVLIAVPLFVFMGCILEKSGAAEKLFNTMYLLLGPVRGGLALTTIIISTLFAACTGVIAASVTTMTLMALPAMLQRNYDHGLSTGVVCAGGTLGILIPPSVMLVVLGPMTNLSVAKLFAGALVPGLLLSTLYIIYIIVRCWAQPSIAPAITTAERDEVKGTILLHTLMYMIPILGLLFAVLGSILLGIASPTEASGVGALGAIIIAMVYRNLNWSTVKGAVIETIKVTSMVFFVIVGAQMFTSVFLFMRGGALIESMLLGLGLGKWGVIFIMMFSIFIMGMFLDWIGIVYIVVPIFLPIAVHLGLDPLYFVLLISINLQMSFLTPPFAYAIFFVKGVAPSNVTTREIYWGVVPFVVLQATGLTLCLIWPKIVMWLPTIAS